MLWKSEIESICWTKRRRRRDMGSLEITNYDVLVEPPQCGRFGEYQLTKHKNHVGNNRLQVFLNLYQEGYNSARQRSDFNACNNIVDKIIQTVCQQCVPKGRFLVSTDNGAGGVTWSMMSDDNAKNLIHKVLQPPDPPPQQPPTQPMPMSMTRNPGMNAPPVKLPPKPTIDDGQKRRRRSSLLRRSASETMVGMVQDLSKKKLTRQDFGRAREEPTWRSTRTGGNGLLTLNRLDVVLTPARNALDPNSQSLGNNRLHILVAMQSTKYQQGSYEAKEAVLDEVLQTVHMFWRGRFMVEGVNGYVELTKEEARQALRSIFDMRSGQTLPKRHSVATTTATSRSMSFMKRPMQTSLAKQASMTMIPSGRQLNMPDVNDLRSAAVKSLQKQKARQNIANRLDQIEKVKALAASPSNAGKSARFTPFPFGGQSVPNRNKRESTVLGKLDASVMQQLVADVDDEDEDDQPLPPTNSNKFGSQFSGGGDYMDM